jgi:hypothetical protein
MRDVQIVVIDERDSTAKRGINRTLVNPLQVMFANVVGWMRLAREHELNLTTPR